jgi:hypothetical protein
LFVGPACRTQKEKKKKRGKKKMTFSISFAVIICSLLLPAKTNKLNNHNNQNILMTRYLENNH